LVQKIERGVTLENALEQTGIPLEEFEEHLAERMKFGKVDDALLHVTAGYAIGLGVKILSEIAQAGPRYEDTVREAEGGSSTHKPISTDLDAAKALVAFGLKARALTAPPKLRGGGGKDPVQPGPKDLWDAAQLGPWKDLKDPAGQS